MRGMNMEDQAQLSENKYSRRSRSADDREANNRAASERPPIVFGNISQFNFDESVLADRRYQFGWTPYIVANDEIHQQFDRAIQSGWECMEASDYPQLKRVYKHDPFKRREDEEELIRRGGQIAMRRKIELKQAEDKYYDEENFHKEQLVSIHTQEHPGGLRVFSHSRTKGSRPVF